MVHLRCSKRLNGLGMLLLLGCLLWLLPLGCSKKTDEGSEKSKAGQTSTPRASQESTVLQVGDKLTLVSTEDPSSGQADENLAESGSVEGEVGASTHTALSTEWVTPGLTAEDFTTFPHDEMLAFLADLPAPDQPIKNNAELDRLLKQEADMMASVDMDLEKTEILLPLADLRAKIATILYAAGDATRAAEYLLSSVTLNPDDANRWELLGDWISIEESTNTIAFLQHAYAMALKTEPDRRSALIKLASTCVSAHNFEAARGLFEIVLDNNDYDPDWMHVALLATSYAQTGKLTEGIHFFEQLFTSHGYTQYLLALAILEHENGDTRSSEDYLAYVASSEPEASPLKAYAVALGNSFKEGK